MQAWAAGMRPPRRRESDRDSLVRVTVDFFRPPRGHARAYPSSPGRHPGTVKRLPPVEGPFGEDLGVGDPTRLQILQDRKERGSRLNLSDCHLPGLDAATSALTASCASPAAASPEPSSSTTPTSARSPPNQAERDSFLQPNHAISTDDI
jgi:hypothetical protein